MEQRELLDEENLNGDFESMLKLDSLSMIEMLPQELIWDLIDFAPESICDLRTASLLRFFLLLTLSILFLFF